VALLDEVQAEVREKGVELALLGVGQPRVQLLNERGYGVDSEPGVVEAALYAMRGGIGDEPHRLPGACRQQRDAPAHQVRRPQRDLPTAFFLALRLLLFALFVHARPPPSPFSPLPYPVVVLTGLAHTWNASTAPTIATAIRSGAVAG